MLKKQLSYRKSIVKHLYFSGPLSSGELSERVGKSLPLVTKILNGLMEEGSVIDTGLAPSTGGRRRSMYALKQDVMYIVSVAMDQFITRIAILDMHNKPVRDVEKFELSLEKNPGALSRLTEKIAQVIQASGIEHEKIVGVGIGMPGFVDSLKGVNYSFLEVPDDSIIEYIGGKLHLPVFIDNDSSLIALAELRFGAARNRRSAMVINIGWGVGLGLILGGELFRGNNGFAGEFSHLPLFNNNKLCSCGKSGCLETEASLLVVIDKVVEGVKKGEITTLHHLSVENVDQAAVDIITAAKKGDKFAVKLLSEAGYSIGRGVAILIHLLNPEVIVLSGRGSTAGKIWLAPIQQALNEHCIPRLASGTEVALSALGYSAEIIGAAALVMENYGKETKRGHGKKAPQAHIQV
ncbi:ROK family transcriptional regulator [Flavitalea sp. BT771]|uniref:ROK family transcriptional regulator n=1 Tax=Flavitalea sp. BT771 TaxID=3063329 RepID=UPI0026E2A700|nr:ROK family transcriptional regulator [Flavitalea sp. BT771]MDO6430203.1 ROK family transcriptional regulator [Flavitalea sp. BT771]MDV6219658.1 ROK family transcriptional regulator [Flavitalea sp. BT771]